MKKSLLVFCMIFFLSGCAVEKYLSLPVGTLVVYASSPGEVTMDAASQGDINSPFTLALLGNLTSLEDINIVLRKVRQKVSDLTKQRQQPIVYASLTNGSLILAKVNDGYQKKLNAHALVVGNSSYSGLSNKLGNPGNDANAISDLLIKLNFSVTKLTDRNKAEFLSDISKFEKTAKNADLTLFFFAGQGIGIEGQNYLMPIDVVANSTSSIKEGSLSIQDIISRFPGNTRLFFIDADTSNPFSINGSR